MKLFRRLLGLPADNATQAHEDEITITRQGAAPGMPPEPVIQSPEGPTPSAETSAPSSRATDGAAPPDRSTVSDNDGPTGSPLLAATRPLPPLETIIVQPGQRIVFGHRSEVGMVRGNNQDAMFSLVSSGVSNDGVPDFGLFVVADGMGGHQEGERASATAVRTISQRILSDIYLAMLRQEMDDSERPGISEVLRGAVEAANDMVSEQIPEGGTTVTCVVVMGDLAYLAHVGDSRAYLISDEGIEQITRDHSLVQRLIELDQLTPEEAAEHPQRNVLYRALGQTDNLEVDVITRRLAARTRLLLCSDGLWNMVAEETMREVALSHSNPQETCDRLVQMANDRGGPDNITVVLIQMPG